MRGEGCWRRDGETTIRNLLTSTRTVAVVGASLDPWRPSFGITRYLIRAGYRVFPVNPTIAGRTLHGELVHPSLGAFGQPVDLVNVFRRSEAAADLVDEAVQAGAKAIWFQLGIHSPEATRRAAEAGLPIVMGHCISVEHSRLAH